MIIINNHNNNHVFLTQDLDKPVLQYKQDSFTINFKKKCPDAFCVDKSAQY